EGSNEKYKCVYSYAHKEIIMGLHVSSDKLYSYSKDGTIKIYQGTTFIDEIIVSSQINTLKVFNDDIFIGCEDGSVYKNKILITRLKNVISSLDVSKNGLFLVFGSFSKKVSIFTTDGKFVSDYIHYDSVYKVKIIGQTIYSASKDKTIKIYSLKNKKIVSDLFCKDEIYNFTLSGDRVIAACKDSKVYFFE
ncbi:Notchless-like WD40 repeat-containing protein, partial [Pseudoloma neurophilia]